MSYVYKLVFLKKYFFGFQNSLKKKKKKFNK